MDLGPAEGEPLRGISTPGIRGGGEGRCQSGPILAETAADHADRRNKQNLLDEMAEMAEVVLATALPDGHDQDGETEVALLAHQLRQAPLAQREDTRVVGVGYAPKRHSLALAERLVAVMRRAGLNGVAALCATSTVFCYALGEALDQQGLTDHARDRLTFPGAHRTYPRLFSTPVEEILNFDDRFAFGLGLVLGGLREQIPEKDLP
ncbi:TetR/AcrR family transcriptional regulator C-terminal domain-containing protein [Streptomyces graminifolii]|uniref:TetR/AcrR family transcriptional regulator C-terminal domain-containing protein n=1 Tax=Streptomyces graminifolii TaxID=1266771 RepID=UPI0040584CB9